MNTKKLTINGMSCGHCVMSLKKELSKMQGVTVNTVDIGSAEGVVDESTVTDQALQHAVEEAGYSLISIQ
jgi:copper chaperone CopZ